MVGVTDRVNAQIISGLAEGEKVVAGTQIEASVTRPARPGGVGIAPGVPGAAGGFGGFR